MVMMIVVTRSTWRGLSKFRLVNHIVGEHGVVIRTTWPGSVKVRFRLLMKAMRTIMYLAIMVMMILVIRTIRGGFWKNTLSFGGLHKLILTLF